MLANYWERFIVGIVCTVAVLSPRAAAAQSNPAPCSLLTQAQVSAALGVSMGADAVFATVGDAHKQLTTPTVKKGKTAFMFHIYGVENASDQMSMEKTLAGNVLAKM
jgi:phosphate/sulfate permease